ncbi:ribulose-phosphate 3-epimerase [Candidatus Peregrinibacteria bacterium]|nr:ribulose-phosphate 3-epimerase [Candidatus Peregrinibacteria bacterium]
MKIKVAPSILSADFGRLSEEIDTVEPYCDFIHLDIMDGHFVPNITIGPPVVRCIKSALPLNTHLMIDNPEKYLEAFMKAGSDRLVVHGEACEDLRKTLKMIDELGIESGVCIKPKTPVTEIKDVLDLVDEVLVMTVEPGFGGQKFMDDMVPKIKELRELGFELDIAVDGGINAETAKICRDAGANVLAAGSYIFKAEDRRAAIESLKG